MRTHQSGAAECLILASGYRANFSAACNPRNCRHHQAARGFTLEKYPHKNRKTPKKDSLLNSINAMFQFQGGISEQDRDKVVAELQKKRHITIDGNNRVAYPQQA